MNSELIKNYLADKKFTGSVIGAIALYAVSRYSGSDGSMTLPSILGGAVVPVWAVGAALGFGTSLFVDIVSDTVLAQIPKNEKYKHAESIVLHLLVGSAAFAFIPKVLYMLGSETKLDNNKLMLFAAAGLATEGISQLLSEYLNKNMAENDSFVVKKD
jgi:hypothetical protein